MTDHPTVIIPAWPPSVQGWDFRCIHVAVASGTWW